MAGTNTKTNSSARRALCLAMAALVIGGAQAQQGEGEGGGTKLMQAQSSGGSHVSVIGPHAASTSSNGLLAFKNAHSTDWAIGNSATWVQSGLFGQANGTSKGEAFTITGAISDENKPDTVGMTHSNATMTNFNYSPMGFANSLFTGNAKDTARPIETAAGSDVAVVNPHYAGASTHVAAGSSLHQPSLLGYFDTLRYMGGGALKPTAIDVGVPAYYHGRRLLGPNNMEAKVNGTSHVQGIGPHAAATSSNGAAAFKDAHSTDWSLTNSATWAQSGLFGRANGTSVTMGYTDTGNPNEYDSLANSTTTSFQSNFAYSPVGRANSNFFSFGKDKMRPVETAAGSDIAVATPYYVGASAGAAGGTSGSEPSLLGYFGTLVHMGAGAIKPTAIDVGYPAYHYPVGK